MKINVTSTIDRAYQVVNSFIARFPNGAMKVLASTVGRIQKRMNVEGTPITYPVKWDSAKQRRAFFATNGFGKGIPYERTFASSHAWQMQTFDGAVGLSAPHPAGAVSGMPPAGFWQSRIHRTRWPWSKTEIFAELARLPADLLVALKISWDESKQ